jgi:hypothetical protein
VDQASAQPQHLRVGIDRDVDRPVLITLLRRIGEMFAAILDPFHRLPQKLGGRDNGYVFRIHAQLRTETAAHLRCLHTQPVFVKIQQRSDGLE